MLAEALEHLVRGVVDHPDDVTVRDNISLYTYAHAKYMIIDGDTAVIMSTNFNVDAMDSERNYGMVDRDPDDVADVQAIFDMDWAAAGGETPRPADLACTRLIVSPNNARARLVELIDGIGQRAGPLLGEVHVTQVLEVGDDLLHGVARRRVGAVGARRHGEGGQREHDGDAEPSTTPGQRGTGAAPRVGDAGEVGTGRRCARGAAGPGRWSSLHDATSSARW